MGESGLQRGREQPEGAQPSPCLGSRRGEGVDGVGCRWDTQTFPAGGEVGKGSVQPDARGRMFAEAACPSLRASERELGL